MDSREATRLREAMCLALWLAGGGKLDGVDADTFTDRAIRKVITDAADKKVDSLRAWLDQLDVRWTQGGRAVDALIERTNDQAELRRRESRARLDGVMLTGTELQRLEAARRYGIGTEGERSE